VLVVAPQPFFDDRGTPIAVRHLLTGLTDLGFAVDLLTYPLGRDIELPGLRTIRCPNPLGFRYVPIGFSLRKVVLDLALAVELRRRLRESRYSYVHAVEESAFPAVLFARKLGIPVIYDMHSSLAEQMTQRLLPRILGLRRLFRVFERWLFRNADLTVCSTGLEPYVHEIAPDAVVREWLFPGLTHDEQAVSTDGLRRHLGVPEGVRIVLYCGNFAPYQGISRLCAAASIVVGEIKDAVFLLVGANEASDYALSGDALTLQSSGALKIVSRQARDDIGAYIQLADVVVSPRIGGDNVSLKIFDYLAAGKPIVASDTPTHRTVLDERCAVFAGPTSEGLALAISGLLKDEALANRIGDAARRRAEEHLSRAAFAERLREIYGQCLDHASRHGQS
jgi:glycosyltransferase involved in cell wall biosynthesis